MSPPQSRRGSSRTAPPDQSSQADRPSRKSPQAACPHQKNRIDPSYPHPRILSCELDSHKFSTAAIFRGALKFDLANEKETIRQYRRRVRQADELAAAPVEDFVTAAHTRKLDLAPQRCEDEADNPGCWL